MSVLLAALNPTDLSPRLAAKVSVDPSTNCWLWLGYTNEKGYGKVHLSRNRPARRVHRVAYEAMVGPIPDGLPLDHTCRVRNCMNPQHLEPVTTAENNKRSIEALGKAPQCSRGHFVARAGTRPCRACSKGCAA